MGTLTYIPTMRKSRFIGSYGYIAPIYRDLQHMKDAFLSTSRQKKSTGRRKIYQNLPNSTSGRQKNLLVDNW